MNIFSKQRKMSTRPNYRRKPAASPKAATPKRVSTPSQKKSFQAKYERNPKALTFEDLKNIRDALHLNDFWQDFPNILLAEAFQEQPNILKTYPWANRELLEFLGDAVIQFLSTKLLLEHPASSTFTPGRATEARSKLVRNATLECFFNRLRLCGYSAGTKTKGCADSFEALVGAMYKWMSINNKHVSLTPIEQWLISTFGLNQVIDDLVRTGELPCDTLLMRDQEIEIPSDEESPEGSDDEPTDIELIREPSDIIVSDPAVQALVRGYSNEFSPTIPNAYLNPKDSVVWNKALGLAARLGTLPFSNWSQLYTFPSLMAKLEKISSKVGDPEFASNIYRIIYPNLEIRSAQEAIKRVITFLRGVQQKDVTFIPQVLRLGIALDLFHNLPDVSTNNAGEFIQGLLDHSLF